MDTDAQHAAVQGVTELDTTQQLKTTTMQFFKKINFKSRGKNKNAFLS